jgi:hypothetical protein
MQEELTAVPLTPELNRGIGLVTLNNDPASPIVSAIWSISQRLELGTRFNFLARPTS